MDFYIDYARFNEIITESPNLTKLLLDQLSIISFQTKSVTEYTDNERLIFNSLVKSKILVKDSKDNEQRYCTAAPDWIDDQKTIPNQSYQYEYTNTGNIKTEITEGEITLYLIAKKLNIDINELVEKYNIEADTIISIEKCESILKDLNIKEDLKLGYKRPEVDFGTFENLEQNINDSAQSEFKLFSES